MALDAGCTSGGGSGIACALVARGATVVLSGPGHVDRAQAEVATLGVQVGDHGADMSQPAEIAAMMTLAAARMAGQ